MQNKLWVLSASVTLLPEPSDASFETTRHIQNTSIFASMTCCKQPLKAVDKTKVVHAFDKICPLDVVHNAK